MIFIIRLYVALTLSWESFADCICMRPRDCFSLLCFPGHTGNVDIKRAVWARSASVFWFWFYSFSFNFSSVVVYIFILLLCFSCFCAAIWRNKERYHWKYNYCQINHQCLYQNQYNPIYCNKKKILLLFSNIQNMPAKYIN